MSDRRYILDNKGEPKLEPDLMAWANWFESGNRRVARSEIGPYIVSTVFLGLNHRWGDGPPILWETMVFKEHESKDMDRCAGGREQAEAMHQAMCEKFGIAAH